MEQQTISIAKGDITAVLNVALGRFDDLKSAGDNINFQTTILSRFDLTSSSSATSGKTIWTEGWPIGDFKRDIAYARSSCVPVITESATRLLKQDYIKMRSSVDSRVSIPITVKQLEVLVRIFESLARRKLSSECKDEHVHEAIRLFRVLTFHAANSGIAQPDGAITEEQRREVKRIERYAERSCPIGSRILVELHKQRFSDYCIVRILHTMLYTGQFEC
jgi:DNA replication licensing factor MCM5